MLETIVELAVRLNIDTFELGMLALFVFMFFISSFVLGAIRKTEVYRQYEVYFRLIDDVIYGAIMAVEGDSVDLTVFTDRAEVRVAKGLVFIDPRMLYVMDRAEAWSKGRGVELDFEQILTRAEGLFQTIKRGLQA